MNLSKTKNFIVNWIANYAKLNQIDNLIIGVSGGIDSALTSTLCATTNIKTHVVSMPIHQAKTELKNASEHIQWLSKNYPNITAVQIDLSELFDFYQKTIPLQYHSDLGFANTRARIRMTTLYQIASANNGIVVGTGNKIEDFAIGFFTKYGDGGVDISPIADLKKTEVKKLAIYCGINSQIINTPPTDGLWEDGRNDEDQIGATYKELEWAMDLKKTQKLNEREKMVIKIYKKLHAKNKHKMTPIPICKIPSEVKN